MTSHYVPSRPSAGFLFVPRRDTTRQLTTRHASSDRLPDLQLSPHSIPAPQTRQHVPAAGLILASIPGQCKSLPRPVQYIIGPCPQPVRLSISHHCYTRPPPPTSLPPSLLPPTLFSKSFPKLPKSLPIRSPPNPCRVRVRVQVHHRRTPCSPHPTPAAAGSFRPGSPPPRGPRGCPRERC